MQPTAATEGLKNLLIQPEVKLDLAGAALQIASEEYPDLDLASYLARLDRLAERAAGQLSLSVEPDVIDRLDGINRTLYREEGFSGNADIYYDPRNSFLNEVLDRRTGIPITLSIIYMEVGRRLGLDIRGVGLPGHFLVKCLAAGGEWLIDPFFGGKTVTEAECRQRLKRLHGEKFSFHPLLSGLRQQASDSGASPGQPEDDLPGPEGFRKSPQRDRKDHSRLSGGGRRDPGPRLRLFSSPTFFRGHRGLESLPGHEAPGVGRPGGQAEPEGGGNPDRSSQLKEATDGRRWVGDGRWRDRARTGPAMVRRLARISHQGA